MTTHNILLVDDEPEILASLKRTLRKQGYAIYAAISGMEGLAILQKQNISLVVSDYKMPGMSGVEFLNKVKSKWPDIMRIMLTGQYDIRVAKEAVNEGEIYRFLIKPCDNLEIKAIINQALKQYEIVQENVYLTKRTMEQNVELHDLNKNLDKKVRERTRIISEQKDELKRFNQELEKKVEEKIEQLRKKDVQLLKMDRIAGIATLAAGIAHEINNPLSFINSSINSLKKGVDIMHDVIRYWHDKPVPEFIMIDYKEYLEKINFSYILSSFENKTDRIKNGIERISKIVNSLKDFSKVDRGNIGKIDIKKSIEEAIEILNVNEVKKYIFITELKEAPLMECFTKEINQSLLYITQNSIDAIDSNGQIKIINSYDEKTDQIFIKITDNGRGMPPDVLRQAFNPFFTTKSVGSGTGLGLSITEKIIKNHGGNIDISSREGEGTTIDIQLPVAGKVKYT